MTSKERASKLLAIMHKHYRECDNDLVFGNDIIAEIDAAVAEERAAVVTYLRELAERRDYPPDKSYLRCVATVVESGEHRTPPKPRYEVRMYRRRSDDNDCDVKVWVVWDHGISGPVPCVSPFLFEMNARDECNRLNKEAAK